MPDPTTETTQTYDMIAAEYARRNSTDDPQRIDVVRPVATSLAPGSVVADVGCGPGREVALLREQGFRVVGLDLSLGQLKTGGQPGVVQADMRRLPLRTGAIDGIWCGAALLHLPRNAVPGVLGEFARAVRGGGQLYLAVAEGDGEGWETASHYGSSRRRWFTYHRQGDLTALLAAAGFTVYQVQRTEGARRNWLYLHAERVG
jgi:SAM-dependent methyltransferase